MAISATCVLVNPLTATSYLPIMILGVAAALASLQSLPDVRQKKLLFQVIFYVGILTQIATQALQYFNAAGGRKDQDRQFANALFAYTRDDPKLLTEFAGDIPYVIGYRFFKDSKLDEAKRFLERSKERGQFVASSYYILATIERTQHPNDVTAAEKLFKQAVESDEKYAAAYYGLALTEVSVKPTAALEDLSLALKYEEGDLICLNINNQTELENYWKNVTSDDQLNKKLKGLQAGCLKP